MELFMQKGEILFVKLPEEIDHHKVRSLALEIDQAIVDKAPEKVVFDFEKVRFMDSSGIGLIMGRYKLMKQRQGEVKIKNPSPNTLRVLKLAGMDRLAKIERNDDK